MALVLCAYNYMVWTSFSLVVIALFATVVIWVFAPVEDSNKPLDEIEKKVYKRRIRALIIMELVVLFISIMAELTLVAVPITFAMLVVLIGLIMGEIKLSFVKRNLKSWCKITNVTLDGTAPSQSCITNDEDYATVTPTYSNGKLSTLTINVSK